MTPRATATRSRLIPLASETESFCRVVTPDNQRWRELGHKFCVRVREYTRTEPAQLTPDELTEDDYDSHNLVLFGSILDNAAILRLYARGRCFTDASYPGRDGAEIRTLLNPLGRGRDVVLIGGSDYGPVHEAAIGLNRTFRDVTTEADGVLCLPRLNFCVAPEHHLARADASYIRRALEIADGEADALVAQAAEFALCHYQTDDVGWVAGVVDAVRPALESPVGSAAIARFATGWALTHGFDGYDDAFRDATDNMLERAAENAGGRVRSRDPSGPLEAVIDDAVAVIKVADHLKSAYGAHRLGDDLARAWESVLRADPGFGADGLRDWRTVDAWMGAALRAERYDLLGGGIVDSLTREAVAERDNLGATIGDPSGGQHAENALRKIGAYTDSGEPLWLRRWMQGASGADAARGGASAGWHTGAYAPDRAPTPARDIPRIHVTPATGRDGQTQWVALRRDLDAGSEYVALRGDALTVRRLTHRGHTWLAEDGGAGGSEASELSWVDTDGLGYVRSTDGGDHALLWRHGEFLLFVDDHSSGRGAAIGACVGEGVTVRDADHPSGYTLRTGMCTMWVATAYEPVTSEAGTARTATLLSLRRELGVSNPRPGAFQVDGAVCYVGEARAGGAVAHAEATVIDGDEAWFVGFESLELDGVSCLSASAPVWLHLTASKSVGRAHASDHCQLAWNDGADYLDLAPGSYEVQLQDFDWTAVGRLTAL